MLPLPCQQRTAACSASDGRLPARAACLRPDRRPGGAGIVPMCGGMCGRASRRLNGKLILPRAALQSTDALRATRPQPLASGPNVVLGIFVPRAARAVGFYGLHARAVRARTGGTSGAGERVRRSAGPVRATRGRRQTDSPREPPAAMAGDAPAAGLLAVLGKADALAARSFARSRC